MKDARPVALLSWICLSPPLVGCAAVPADDEKAALEQQALAVSRTSYVVDEVTRSNASIDSRVRAEKYADMKVSPFAFFRGSNHLYWKDLGSSPSLQTYGGTAGTRTWLSGDMHADNTGSFDDDHGDVVFGLNDFDQAVIGDYQLDVWRLAVSLVLVARQNGGFSAGDEAAVVDALSEGYLDAIDSFAGGSGEATRKFTATNTYGLLDDFLADVTAHNSRTKMLDDWTIKVSGVRRLDAAGNPELAAVPAGIDLDIRSRMGSYRATLSGGGTSLSAGYFNVKGVAERLHAGLGSLGVARYYVLIEGASSSQSDDRILDVKAQIAPAAWSTLSPAAVSATNAACGGNMARRAVTGYKALGYRVDDHLGWMTLADGIDYSVRERSPFKDTFTTDDLDSMTRITKLAEQWGQVLAAHHARADRDWDAVSLPQSVDDEISALTSGDHAGFRAAVRALAVSYADQVELDYESFSANF